MSQSKAIKRLEQLQEKLFTEDPLAIKYIERVQNVIRDPSQEIYISEQIDNDFKSMLPEEREKLKRLLFEKWQDEFQFMPTRFEEPLTYAEIRITYQSILETAEKYFHSVSKTPIVIGTLPISAINAWAMPVDSGNEYIIAIPRGIVNFFDKFSLIITQALPVMDNNHRRSCNPELVEKELNQNPDIENRFFEAIYSFLVLGDIGLSEVWKVDKFTRIYAQGIREAMLHFLIGHEYGHIMLKHVQKGKKIISQIGSEKVKRIMFETNEEYLADDLGAWLTIYTLTKENDIKWSFLGFMTFLSCYDILEEGLSILKTNKPGNFHYDTHPSPVYRRTNLLNEFRKSTFIPQKAIENALRFSVKMHNVINMLWLRTTPKLRKLYSDGIRPHDRWNN
jgi:hypothetical protein